MDVLCQSFGYGPSQALVDIDQVPFVILQGLIEQREFVRVYHQSKRAAKSGRPEDEPDGPMVDILWQVMHGRRQWLMSRESRPETLGAPDAD